MTFRSAAIFLLMAAVLVAAPAAPATDASDVLGSGRVVLVPLNLGVRASAEVEPGVEPVWHEMLTHFAAQPQRVAALERNSAAALWNDVMTEVNSKPNPDVYQAYALFARRIADQVDYSAIVFPSLVTRAARVQGETAAWDGVRRHVELTGAQPLDALAGTDLVVSHQGVRGELAAASLHVAVLSPDGELRYEGAGGLALLQQLDRETDPRGEQQVAVAMRHDAFADTGELREGIEAAFRSPLPASRAH